MFIGNVDGLDYVPRLHSTEVKHYNNISTCVVEIKIAFDNAIKKKLVTKTLTQIKRQNGFKEFLMELLTEELDKHYDDISTIETYQHIPYNYKEYKQDTGYIGGKLMVGLTLDKLYTKEQLLQDLDFLVDEFIQRKCTNVQIRTRNGIKEIY